jgi:hypothetical protein
LKTLRDRNLDEATFEEKMEIISTFGIMVHPAEDLKSMRVVCKVSLEEAQSDKSQGHGESEAATGCRKVHFGPPFRTTRKTHSKTFPPDY